MKRRAAWLLAALAVALQALWPLLAQAKPRAFVLVPVCSIGSETHYAEVPLGKSPAEDRSSLHFQHCQLCTMGADRAAAVDFPRLQRAAADRADDAVPLLSRAVAPGSPVLPPAPPRAPPFAS